jgi:serine/threonine protein kinase
MSLPDDTQLVETLGEGSFAVVYVARLRDGAMLRTVVLKVLKADWADDQEILSRARDEAAMLARLQHDNIIRVEQLTDLHGHTAVVMEYVRGLTLDRVLEQAGPMPVEVAISVCHAVADALDAAFNQIPPGFEGPLRVVHRDIKPSNVMLSVRGDVKVLDFGTAHAEFIGRQAETGNVTPGSPLYMAPERFDGLARGAEVDVYALGCLLYELVTGMPLGRLSVHPTRHEKEVAKKVKAMSPPDLEEGIALAMLRSLIQRSVSYEPAHRPSAAEMRSLCVSLIKRLPGHRMTRIRYCGSVVAPIYQDRKRLPPVPLDGTLDPKEMAKAVLEAHETDRTDQPTETPEPAPVPPLAAEVSVQAPPRKRVGSSGRKPVGLMVVMFLALALMAAALLFLVGQERAEKVGAIQTDPVVVVPAETPVDAPVVESGSEQRSAQPETTPETPRQAQGDDTPTRQAAPEPKPAENTAKAEVAKKPATTSSATSKRAVTAKPAPPAPKAAPAVQQAPAGAPVTVKVVSAPAGATLTIAGQRIVTPGEIRLVPGSHSAKIVFPDGVGGRCTVRVSDGERLVFRATGGSLTCP